MFLSDQDDEQLTYQEALTLVRIEHGDNAQVLPWNKLPSPFDEELREYFEAGKIPKSNLSIILENNLFDSMFCFRGNFHTLDDTILWIESHLPVDCFGNWETVKKWNEDGGVNSRRFDWEALRNGRW